MSRGVHNSKKRVKVIKRKVGGISPLDKGLPLNSRKYQQMIPSDNACWEDECGQECIITLLDYNPSEICNNAE